MSFEPQDRSSGGPGWFRGGVSLSSLVQIVVVFAGVIGAGYVLKYRVDQIETQHVEILAVARAESNRSEKLELAIVKLAGEVRALRQLLFEKRVLRVPPEERDRAGEGQEQ